MELNQYQESAAETAIYPRDGISGLAYTALGLAGEAGEVANKVKKLIRDHGGQVIPSAIPDIAAELGDVLWYVAMTASQLGIRLDSVAASNLDKLRRRSEAGRIGGSGDDR